MFRNADFKPKPKTINCVLMNGGVGDHMASLSALTYLITNYPWITPLVWTPNFLKGFASHVLPPKTRVYDYTAMRKEYNPNRTTKTTAWDGITSPMKIHCLDYAFLKLCDENPSIEHKNYPQINPALINIDSFALPKKYVVITTGYTAKVREFPAKHINEVARYVLSNGHIPVFLGQTSTATGAQHVIKGSFAEEVDLSIGRNLVDKTTLLEAAKIMGDATAVIGVDNGLLHVAGCTQVPIVGGFTTVNPELRMPVRNNILGHNYYTVLPDQDLGCKFCQVKTNFLYNHDYKNCIYKDNLCTNQMTAEKFISHLETILIKK